ncbi:hypothetical protein FOPG_12135 [Fusarium oxysporum f. sp. conglutinans race 2 54008]|uniref:Uncharacterized protein n=1 Tax=Fusarium oxysporum f. sp. conglutinans race 2 54008 TaxID=1089457 RepID=X0HKG2_FUSOX|nr:hypothetical protein FOPG_12135 [Fusarium oxysporum f. sp. conglutinans race 2 54008]
MLPRFSRSIFTLLSRRSQAPKRLAPPSPSNPQAQEPTHEEMQRYLYRRAKAEDAAKECSVILPRRYSKTLARLMVSGNP